MELGQIQTSKVNSKLDGTTGCGDSLMEDSSGGGGGGSKFMESGKSNGSSAMRRLAVHLDGGDCEQEGDGYEDDDDEDYGDEDEEMEEEEEEDEDEEMEEDDIMRDEDDDVVAATTTRTATYHCGQMGGGGGAGGYCASEPYGVDGDEVRGAGCFEPTRRLKLVRHSDGGSRTTKVARFGGGGGGGGASGRDRVSPASQFGRYQFEDRRQHPGSHNGNENENNNNRSASAASYGSSSQASTLSPSLAVATTTTMATAPPPPSSSSAASVYLQFACEHSDPEQPPVAESAQVNGQQQQGCKLAIMSPRQREQQQQQPQQTELQSASSPPPLLSSNKWITANSATLEQVQSQQQQQQQQTSGTIPLQTSANPLQLAPPQHLNQSSQQPVASQRSSEPNQRRHNTNINTNTNINGHLNQQTHHHQKRQQLAFGSRAHNGHGGRVAESNNCRATQDNTQNINRCDSSNICAADDDGSLSNLSQQTTTATASEQQRENGASSERVDRRFVVDRGGGGGGGGRRGGFVTETEAQIGADGEASGGIVRVAPIVEASSSSSSSPLESSGRGGEHASTMIGHHQRQINPTPADLASEACQILQAAGSSNSNRLTASSPTQTDGCHSPNIYLNNHQQQELTAKPSKNPTTSVTLRTPTTASNAGSKSPSQFMSNQVPATTTTVSSTSSSSSSSSSTCSSSPSSIPSYPPQASMFHRGQQQQHQQPKNNEQLQRIPHPPPSNLLATTARITSISNQSIETENHKFLEQQHYYQQQQQQQQQQPLQRQYPPNHPLGNTKHLCSICGDRATGKHYGVYSCEGCKGFFKRTIRKDIVYVCRSDGNCLIDMRQRNRCQYCRYQKCLRQGMKREAVQEEKQRLKLRACAAAAAAAATATTTGSAGLNNHHHHSSCDNQVESTSMIGQQTTFNGTNNNNINCSRSDDLTSTQLASNNNHHHHQQQQQHYGSNSSFINTPQHKQADISPNQTHISDIVEAQLNVNDRQNLHLPTSSSSSSNQHFDPHQQQQQNSNPNHQINISPAPSSTLSPATTTTTSMNSVNAHHYLASPNNHHHHPLNHNHYQPHNSSNRLPVMRDFSSYYNETTINGNNNNGINDYHHAHQPPRKYSRIDDLTLKWAAQMQIEQLLDWAKGVPNFTELLVDDQITLLKAYWNELIISDMAFKSIEALKENLKERERHGDGSNSRRCLCVGRGLFINENQAYEIGLSNMFNRIIDELVVKMYDMRIDPNELAYLRAIILFNPETQGLKTSQPIEEYRGNVYTALEMYCRKTYDDQPNRFGKLLLRLPALRSIGLKCDSMRRVCDTNNNNLQLVKVESSTTNQQQATGGGSSPSGSSTTMLGYQVKLLFFDICYEASAIDSFLRSSLMYR